MTLRERRNNKQMKQIEIAAKLEVDRSIISKWENGVLLPSTKKALALAALYGCTVDELLRGDGGTPTQTK